MKRALALVALCLSSARALNPIEVKGRGFYDSKTGERFFMKGIDYQPGGSSAVRSGNDPLSDPEICKRDAFVWQQLGLNTIRVYSIDPTLNHDECMSILNAAGIYLVLDVNSALSGQHLNRYEPWTTYTADYMEHVFSVQKAFSSYPNTLAFFAANEVVNDEQSAKYSPRYVRAVIRDMRAYAEANLPRTVPIGYSAADDLKYREELSDYLACDAPGRADFYGVNTYQWCGQQTFESAGYDKLHAAYANYSLPVFFSEFGCNLVRPRIFQEIEAMYSPRMTDVFSGGLLYEYTLEDNEYGVVEYPDKKEDPVKLLAEYENLKSRFEKVNNVTGSTSMDSEAPQCPDASSYSNLNGTTDLPDSVSRTLIKNDIKGIQDGKLGKVSDLSVTLPILKSDGSKVEGASLDKLSDITTVEKDPTAVKTGALPSATASVAGSSSSEKDSKGSKTKGTESDDSKDKSKKSAASSISMPTQLFGTALLAVAMAFVA